MKKSELRDIIKEEIQSVGDITFDIGKLYTFGDGFNKVNEEGAFFEEKDEYPESVKKIFNKFGIPPNAHSTVLTMMAYINKNPKALKTILKSAGMLENKKGEN